MEYLANCSVCGHHTIIDTIKEIKRTTTRKPQRVTKCINCGKTTRATIIGIVEKPKNATVTINPEFVTTNTLRIKLFS